MANSSEAHPLQNNIQNIARMEQAATREVSRSGRIGKWITDRAGSMTFVVCQALGFAAWTIWNVALPPQWRFDPYPFGLLTTIVSLESVIIAILVLSTQNRMMNQTDRRNHLNLQVDMLTEQEMTMTLRMLQRLCEHAGVQPESTEEVRLDQLMEETNVAEVMKEIDKKMPSTD
jgi:uncharacterized membrane protein